jgi:hypothetical protein
MVWLPPSTKQLFCRLLLGSVDCWRTMDLLFGGCIRSSAIGYCGGWGFGCQPSLPVVEVELPSVRDSLKNSWCQARHILRSNLPFRDFEVGFMLYGFASDHHLLRAQTAP